MYYINACSTISHQNSFQNKNWIDELSVLSNNSELITPDYKKIITPGSLRRMSKIIRMGIACGKDCTEQSNTHNPDAIIVGTGLGCLTDTETFLKNTITIEGLIPPTAFIQSTHNTIAGQISLALKNHNYNNTHTQNSLSFEHSLIDAILCLNEDCNSVLVGAADENIPLMDDLAKQLGFVFLNNKLTSGSSFFMLSKQKNEHSKVALVDSLTIGLNKENPSLIIESFLQNNNITSNNIDLILSSTYGSKISEPLINDTNHISLSKYSGYYFSNIAFGMHLATEMMTKQNSMLDSKQKPKTVLLYNNLNNKNIGLTLLKSIEA